MVKLLVTSPCTYNLPTTTTQCSQALAASDTRKTRHEILPSPIAEVEEVTVYRTLRDLGDQG